ncbi:ubiquitin-associated domain-containing protein 2 isoform X1 [Lepeophtheirus salmonis]|uniref:ubiquitin-associated domain-containing protein 2 isoform X1 n=1 Tax=Lepeophtheirus salmonis TaxID=72036 RepID=UPI001AE61074|nr:ubiquitin-associated domain-containing protein 2-like isoform X1 [Lepeophtheirus salmonis]
MTSFQTIFPSHLRPKNFSSDWRSNNLHVTMSGGLFHIHFYRAPISKLLSIYILLSHKLIQYLPINSLKCNVPSITLNKETVISILWSKAGFVDLTYAILASVLIYQFRVFERRYGSLKFSSLLISSFLISVLLEVGLNVVIQSNEHLANGPFGLFVPWFVPFYFEIPPNKAVFGGVISQKLKVYLVGLLLFALSLENSIAFGSAIIAGMVCKWNICWIRDAIRVPYCIGKILSKYSWLVESSTSLYKQPIGATLEIQRAFQLEHLLRDHL